MGSTISDEMIINFQQSDKKKDLKGLMFFPFLPAPGEIYSFCTENGFLQLKNYTFTKLDFFVFKHVTEAA